MNNKLILLMNIENWIFLSYFVLIFKTTNFLWCSVKGHSQFMRDQNLYFLFLKFKHNYFQKNVKDHSQKPLKFNKRVTAIF